MAKLSQLADYQSPWLKAEDLAGKPRRVRIKDYEVADMKQQDGSKQTKIVLSFLGKAKKLILNRSNAAALGAALGDDLDEWTGAEIILSPGKTPNGQDTITVAVIPDEQTPAPVPANAPGAADNPFNDKADLPF